MPEYEVKEISSGQENTTWLILLNKKGEVKKTRVANSLCVSLKVGDVISADWKKQSDGYTISRIERLNSDQVAALAAKKPTKSENPGSSRAPQDSREIVIESYRLAGLMDCTTIVWRGEKDPLKAVQVLSALAEAIAREMLALEEKLKGGKS